MFWVSLNKKNKYVSRNIFFFFNFRKRVNEFEHVVITPSCPGVNVTSTQINDENEDFSSRRRYHQTLPYHQSIPTTS